jgi:acetyltransferase-like isoleucine patch superfamily enzyme
MSEIHQTAILEKDVIIGDNVFIGAFCLISKGVIIGDNCKICDHISIPENVILEDNVYIGNNVSFVKNYKETILKYGAKIKENSIIECGVSIGKFSIIECGTYVTKDIPDNMYISGNPQEEKYTICKCGKDLNSRDKSCIDCNSMLRYNPFYEDYIVEDIS